jgi:hypothetical protein
MPRLWLHRAALSGAEEGVWLTISVPPAGCGTTPDDAHSEISDTVETFRLPEICCLPTVYRDGLCRFCAWEYPGVSVVARSVPSNPHVLDTMQRV